MSRKKWDTRWPKTREEQDLYLTLLWTDNHTEKAIADFFRVGKGTIVRRRHDLELSSAGRKRDEVKGFVRYERFMELLKLHDAKASEAESGGEEKGAAEEAAPVEASSEPTSAGAERTASRRKPKYQITADWRLQCEYRDENKLQCSYIKEPGSDYCELHGG